MMKKIFTILLALALVLSFSVVATPVNASINPAELAVNITAPGDDDDIMGGQTFTVTANVTNNATGYAAYAYDVKATIEIIGNAKLKAVANNDPTKNVVIADGKLSSNETAAVSWILECTDGGDVSIKVTPSGKDGVSDNPIQSIYRYPDTVSIHQKKVLQVTIVAPPDFTACNVTDGFNVTANVKNISSLNATDVKLKITIDRYAELKAGEVATLNVGILNSLKTSANYTWALKCTGDGFSRITVTPSGKVSPSLAAILDAALTPDTVTVRQGIFTAENITLVEGWNLISLPLIPLDSGINNINVVLAGILDDVISVWHWDTAIKDWRSFAPGASSNLASMKDGKAYWVNMKAAQNLTLAGTAMPKGGGLPPAYDVVVGWNMVGFKSTANATAEIYLAGTEPIIRIYGFEDGKWFLIPGPPYNDPKLEPGLGYWVAFTKTGTIYP
jgi:hypothetical protein